VSCCGDNIVSDLPFVTGWVALGSKAQELADVMLLCLISVNRYIINKCFFCPQIKRWDGMYSAEAERSKVSFDQFSFVLMLKFV